MILVAASEAAQLIKVFVSYPFIAYLSDKYGRYVVWQETAKL